MFRTLKPITEQVEISLDGELVAVSAGISLAAALLLHGSSPFRQTRKSASARAPFCMIGACFDCLVEVDAQPNQRACQVQVTAGMQVRRQLAEPGQA